jgi:hypothetical protein
MELRDLQLRLTGPDGDAGAVAGLHEAEHEVFRLHGLLKMWKTCSTAAPGGDEVISSRCGELYDMLQHAVVDFVERFRHVKDLEAQRDALHSEWEKSLAKTEKTRRHKR